MVYNNDMKRTLVVGVTAATTFGGLFGCNNLQNAGGSIEVLPLEGGAVSVRGYDPARLNPLGKGMLWLAEQVGTTRPSVRTGGETLAEGAEPSTKTSIGTIRPRYPAERFVGKDLAEAALAKLRKSNPSGCATNNSRTKQPVLDGSNPDTKVCLRLKSAQVSANGEVQVEPYLPTYLGDLPATLADPKNTAQCAKLFGVLQAMGGELLDKAGSMRPGRHVAVGVTVFGGTLQNPCDVHDLPFETKEGPARGSLS